MPWVQTTASSHEASHVANSDLGRAWRRDGAVRLPDPRFLLMTALVVEVGNWYTHKRQLQNRADAAALAAGVEYSSQIYRCLSSNPADVAIAEAELRKTARAFAGDRTYLPATGGGPDRQTDPARANDQIANQNNLDVVLNSTTYTAGTDHSDGGAPCFNHTGDTISPGGGQWTDVKVTENDTGAIWKHFNPDLHARARVDLRPAQDRAASYPSAFPTIGSRTRRRDSSTSAMDPCSARRTCSNG